MRIIALGDTHGRTDWKRIVEEETFDKVVFLGDYFDSHDFITAEQQMDNFQDLLAYKRANVEKVVLLIGNHDFHYHRKISQTYSGYEYFSEFEIQDLFQFALEEDLVQMCFLYQKILFTHAGITKTWAKANKIDLNNLENSINQLFKNTPKAFGYNPGKLNDPYGEEICQTPIWVRPKSLRQNAIEGFTQVVGHTPQPGIRLDDKIIFIDTIGTSGEYLSIQNDEMSIVQNQTKI